MPAGNPDGGQWTDGDGGYVPKPKPRPAQAGDDVTGSNPEKIAPQNPDIQNAIERLRSAAGTVSQRRCAEYVRLALHAGGINLEMVNDAKDYGRSLLKAGFEPVAIWDGVGYISQQGYIYGYTPQAGDVAVIQPYKNGNPSGHMTMYEGAFWASDYWQRDMWGGNGYRTLKPHYVIYRYPKW